MVTLTLMRHGLVENPRHVIYGALPGFGLSEAGKWDVEVKAQELVGEKYEQLYASPLQRAQETAEIVRRIAYPNLAIITDKRLREWVYISQGLTREEWEHRYHELYATYHRDPFKLPAEVDHQTFETFEQLSVRVHSFVDEIKDGQAEKVLAIAHGDPIMMALHNELKEDFVSCRKNHYVEVGESKTLIFDGDQTRLV